MIQPVPWNVAYYTSAHVVNPALHTINQGIHSRHCWFSAIYGCTKILEVGCGNGALCEWLADEFGKLVTGVDLVAGPYMRKGYEFQTLDIMQEDLPRGFDAVLSFDVLEHMETDKVPYVLANIDASARVCVLQIAGYAADPEHLTVKSPVWWFNAIWQHMKSTNRRWVIQVFERYKEKSSPVYVFVGRPA